MILEIDAALYHAYIPRPHSQQVSYRASKQEDKKLPTNQLGLFDQDPIVHDSAFTTCPSKVNLATVVHDKLELQAF